MKKDLDKLFSKSVQTYYFLLVIVVIIKVLGGDYFEMDLLNPYIIKLNKIITTLKLENLWYAISLYIYSVVIIGITCNDNSKRLKKYCLWTIPITILIQLLKNGNAVFVIIDFFYLLLLSIIYSVINNDMKISIKNYIFSTLFINIIQLISIVIRNNKVWVAGGNFIIDFIYNLDFLITMIIVYKLFFMKGAGDICGMVVSSGSQKLISLRDSLDEWHAKSLDRKPNNKEDKITNAIYIPLYILWNLFTMFIIVVISFLNDAFVEAIFITVAFWFNKRSFGKPFHFKSVAVCFAFSSFVYYALTRITFKTGTSFFIPIFLGVALSYVTSHFVEKNTKLYKGMSEELLYKTVKQVNDDPIVIKICKEYYCDRLIDVKIARINGYSIDTIRKKRQEVNKRLRKLN